LAGFRIAGDQNQHRFRFRERGQVMEMAVVAIREMGVAVADDFRRGGQMIITPAPIFCMTRSRRAR
jgi:hypothetical protein